MGSDLRKAYIEPDFRTPAHSGIKTDRQYCFRCGKVVRVGKGRIIHVIDGGLNALHPDDESKYTPDAGDMGAQIVGSDCLKKIGTEFEFKA